MIRTSPIVGTDQADHIHGVGCGCAATAPAPSPGAAGDPAEPSTECSPLTFLPAWWSGFLFHVLNPRQVATYVYLAMLCDAGGACHPTIEQMREDLGLLSTTMVFEALSVLEELGFIVRERQSFPDSRSRRNLYRRTACEYTILRLVQRERLDGTLSPSDRSEAPASEESRQLMDEGLRSVLGDRFERYARATTAAKRAVLEEELEAILQERPAGIYA